MNSFENIMPPAAASPGVQSGRPANAPPLVVARRALQGTTRNAKGADSLTCPLTCPFFSPVPFCVPRADMIGGNAGSFPICQPNGDPMRAVSLTCPLTCPFFSPVPFCVPPRRHGWGKRRQLPIYQPNGDPMGVSSLGAKPACRQPMEEPGGRSHRAHNGLQ